MSLGSDNGGVNNQKLVNFVGRYVEIRGTRDRYPDYSVAINASGIVAAKKPE
jgi:hypothetical protein